MTKVLTGSADLLSRVWYREGGLASRVEGILGCITVGRVELRPEGRCANPVITASTDACVSSSCLPDVGGEGVGSARSVLSGRGGRGAVVGTLFDRSASGSVGPSLVV